MKNRLVRLIAALCALIMVLSCAVACANDTQNPDNTPTTDDATDSTDSTDKDNAEEDKDIVYTATIPEGYTYGLDDSFVVYAYPEDVFVWKDYDWQHSKRMF